MHRLLRSVLGAHAHVPTVLGIAFLAIAVLLLIMQAITRACGGCDTGWTRRTLATAMLLIVGVSVIVTNVLFVLPHITPPVLRRIAMGGIPLLVLATIVIPAMGWLMRTRYWVTLMSTLISLIACSVVLAASNAVIDSLQGGNRGFSIVKHRTDTLDRFMDGN